MIFVDEGLLVPHTAVFSQAKIVDFRSNRKRVCNFLVINIARMVELCKQVIEYVDPQTTSITAAATLRH